MADATKPGHGAPCWYEIMTPDAGTAKAFYAQLFGWDMQTHDMGGFPYTVLRQGGKDFGGVMAMEGPKWQGIPPHWMIYFAVDDVDAAAKKVTELGGKVCVPPTDVPPGRFAVVSDPTGATFSLWKGK